MGRRALRKLNPNIDFSHHLRTLDQLSAPLDFATLFGRKAPVEIEMGSGKGLFITNASMVRPEHNFLGIEIAEKYAQFAAAKLAREKRSNAIMVSGDGLKLFREFIPDRSVRAVHVYFPDPWWKARHRKRRVLNEAFLKDVDRVLELDGRLHFWTDVEEYFQSTLELIPTVVKWDGPLPVPETPAQHDLDFRTHFERRTRLSALPVFRAEYRKPQ